jgi:hypothetical protein
MTMHKYSLTIHDLDTYGVTEVLTFLRGGSPADAAAANDQPAVKTVKGKAKAAPIDPATAAAVGPIAQGQSAAPEASKAPVPWALTAAEVKKRAVVFMEAAPENGEIFAKRLAEFNTLDGKTVTKLSELPELAYEQFVQRLVPDVVIPAAAGSASLLD